MTNLEIKVVAQNIEEIKNEALKVKAVDKGILYQTDTYFLTGNYRLKLREEVSKSYLVLYLRKNVLNSKNSKYYILNVNKIFLKLIKYILTFIFGVKVIVDKKRELFIYKNTRIHFDKVNSLGNYIELETVFHKSQNENELKKEHQYVIESLGLNKLEKVSRSYSDLILK